MTQQPIRVSWRFDYFADKDVIQFTIKVGDVQGVAIGLNADGFFTLSEGIVQEGQPFLEEVKKRRAEGTKEDIKVEFDEDAWNRLMGWDKKETDNA